MRCAWHVATNRVEGEDRPSREQGGRIVRTERGSKARSKTATAVEGDIRTTRRKTYETRRNSDEAKADRSASAGCEVAAMGSGCSDSDARLGPSVTLGLDARHSGHRTCLRPPSRWGVLSQSQSRTPKCSTARLPSRRVLVSSSSSSCSPVSSSSPRIL